MKRLLFAIGQDPVLTAALLAALLSALAVPPSTAYWHYIDWQVLALLFCLMTVVAGLQQSGVFDCLSSWLCNQANTARQISLVLMLLCFFGAMVITNDVALLIFVPFAIMMLSKMEQQQLMPYVIVLQTIAANLGSMLTPVGNPQNLYLYARYHLNARDFFAATGMITASSLVILLLLCSLISNQPLEQHKSQYHPRLKHRLFVISLLLFACCLSTVFHIIPWPVTLIAVVLVYLAIDRKLLQKVDYGLLVTFVCFFIFTGNLGQLTWLQDTLGRWIMGRELWVAALTSQVISNVPAAVLLSGFTQNGLPLLLGCDIGGLGTLVASLASLISYKAYSRYPAANKKRYLKLFFLLNAVLLVCLLCFAQWVVLPLL